MLEHYRSDEPIGLYGWLSRNKLAEGVIRDFNRYEQGLLMVDSAEPTETGERTDLAGEFRLGSLVVDGDPAAHALTLTPSSHTDRLGIEGIYYGIDLANQPEVIETKSVFVTHSTLLRSPHDHETEVAELTGRFNKPELEAIMRMAGKMATSLETVAKLPQQVLSSTYARRAVLNRTAAVDPSVMYALQEHTLDDLSTLFPTSHQRAEANADETSKEVVHILEWSEFLEEASSLLRQESGVNQPEAIIALQYEAGTNHYLLKIEAEYGKLSQVKILSYDGTGASHKQKFDLKTEADEDDLDRLRISPAWNRDELLECLRQGSPISVDVYGSYLQLEEEEDMTVTTSISRVTDIRSRKRPAA